MRRREFHALVGGAIGALRVFCAQQQTGKVPRVGYLRLTSPADRPPLRRLPAKAARARVG